MAIKRSEFSARGGWWVLAQAPIMIIAALVPLFWGARSFDGTNAIQVIGTVMSALGVLLAIAGVAALGRGLTPFPRPMPQAQLQQGGIYGLVRHPIYSGFILASIGWSLVWLSGPGLVFCVLVAIFFDRKSAFEETLLREKFPGYQNYMLRVRKLLPWIY
ncbi:MAG: isoprenylcysteine carboxylmethyltransferase family protein [Burkholderiales bacterium]